MNIIKKPVGGITFDELVQYVELKLKMEMTMSGNMDAYDAYTDRKDTIKVGDVLTDNYNPDGYYIVVDMQVNRDGEYRGYGMNVEVINDELKITDGATHFSGKLYIDRKTGMNVVQLKKKFANKHIMDQINEYEAKIAQLQKQLVK